MTNVSLVVDWLYSHTADVACGLADWLHTQGHAVDIFSASAKRQPTHASWDTQIRSQQTSLRKYSMLVWFVPPNVSEIKMAGQLCKVVLAAPTAKAAKAMSKAAVYAWAVLCFSDEAKQWFADNMPTVRTVLALPCPGFDPVVIPNPLPNRLVVAAPSHTAMTQSLPRLMPNHSKLTVQLITRGDGQHRKHVKTPRRLTHIKNNDLAALPELLSQGSLLLWQSQHVQDNIGLLSLWLGIPVVSNKSIVGLTSPALTVVDDRDLITTANELMANQDQLTAMRQQTVTGLLQRRHAWQQALRSLF